jgi:PhnB protein
MSSNHIRHRFGAVRPYLYGYSDLFDLVKHAFGAVELERFEFGPTEHHIEAKIGDSVVVLELMPEPPATATRASIYVYVPNVDDAYQRALEKGATSVQAPQDKPYSERQAGVKDSFGNIWWMSTYKDLTAS